MFFEVVKITLWQSVVSKNRVDCGVAVKFIKLQLNEFLLTWFFSCSNSSIHWWRWWGRRYSLSFSISKLGCLIFTSTLRWWHVFLSNFKLSYLVSNYKVTTLHLLYILNERLKNTLLARFFEIYARKFITQVRH